MEQLAENAAVNAKQWVAVMQWLAIVVVSILACVAYGIAHDQITARICVEYFTVGHPQVVPSRDPTILAFVWGVVATWWVGAILGKLLATVARMGPRPKRSVTSLLRPMAVLFGCNTMFACLAGFAGYIAASNGWVWLVSRIAENVPPQKHIAFLIDLWAHDASYLGGSVGGIMLVVWAWRSRRGRITLTSRSIARDELAHWPRRYAALTKRINHSLPDSIGRCDYQALFRQFREPQSVTRE
jgi:hypothetical protein